MYSFKTVCVIQINNEHKGKLFVNIFKLEILKVNNFMGIITEL